MPKKAATSIQKSAPGPPVPMAVATPTMLPVPIVAESAVQSAPNWLTSPFTPGSTSWWNMYWNARLRLKRWMKRRMHVRRRPVTRMEAMSGTPHTQPSTMSTKPVKDASQSLVASTVFATAPVCAASGVVSTTFSAVGAAFVAVCASVASPAKTAVPTAASLFFIVDLSVSFSENKAILPKAPHAIKVSRWRACGLRGRGCGGPRGPGGRRRA